MAEKSMYQIATEMAKEFEQLGKLVQATFLDIPVRTNHSDEEVDQLNELYKDNLEQCFNLRSEGISWDFVEVPQEALVGCPAGAVKAAKEALGAMGGVGAVFNSLRVEDGSQDCYTAVRCISVMSDILSKAMDNKHLFIEVQ